MALGSSALSFTSPPCAAALWASGWLQRAQARAPDISHGNSTVGPLELGLRSPSHLDTYCLSGAACKFFLVRSSLTADVVMSILIVPYMAMGV